MENDSDRQRGVEKVDNNSGTRTVRGKQTEMKRKQKSRTSVETSFIPDILGNEEENNKLLKHVEVRASTSPRVCDGVSLSACVRARECL